MKTERDLTHVKQIPIDMEMLMAVLTEDAFAQVQAVIRVVNSAHNKAVEGAARIAADAHSDEGGHVIAEEIRAKLLRAP